MQTIKDIMRVPALYTSTDEISELIATNSLESLASYMPPEESVVDVVIGIHNDKIGVLAITNRRVLFVDESILTPTITDIELRDILAASAVKRLYLGTLYIKHTGGVFMLEKVTRKHARRIAKHLDSIAIANQEQFMRYAM